MKRPVSRRRKASAAARLRPFSVLIAIVAVGLVGTVGFAVAWPGFAPKQIVVSGNRIVSRDAILARAGISMRENVWLQSPSAIAARIETIPYVADARVGRLPPATVTIDIRERVPFAVVRGGGRAALVDRDLRVLEPFTGDPVSLPAFTLRKTVALDPGTFLNDPSVIALRDDYAAMLAGHVVPVSLSLDRFGGVVATIRGGIALLLGDDANLTAKLALVDPILAQVVRRQRHVAAIDLRAPNTPVIVYK